MWAVARAIATKKGIAESELLMKVSPPTLRKVSNDDAAADASDPVTAHCRVAVRTLKDLGMITEGDARVLWTGTPPTRYAEFCQQLRNAVFGAENLSSVRDIRNSKGSRDLLRGLVWFLSKDPTSSPWSWPEVFQDPTAGTDDNSRVFVNENRWNGFRYWAPALGLGEVESVFRESSGALTPNATRAIRDTVFDLYSKDYEVPVTRFLSDLRDRLPVLPGGSIAAGLDWPPPEEFLDPATSYALEAGSLRGWLLLESRADANDTVLLSDLSGTGNHRSVTHVVVKGLIDV
jgi:hypothetical protein